MRAQTMWDHYQQNFKSPLSTPHLFLSNLYTVHQLSIAYQNCSNYERFGKVQSTMARSRLVSTDSEQTARWRPSSQKLLSSSINFLNVQLNIRSVTVPIDFNHSCFPHELGLEKVEWDCLLQKHIIIYYYHES